MRSGAVTWTRGWDPKSVSSGFQTTVRVSWECLIFPNMLTSPQALRVCVSGRRPTSGLRPEIGKTKSPKDRFCFTGKIRKKSPQKWVKVGKRPIKEGKRPIKAMVLVGISVGCLMGCFLAPPPWRKTAPLKRPIKGSSGCRKRSAAKGVRSLFFVFGTLSVTFRSLFLMRLSHFSSLFCQTPFAGLLLRHPEVYEIFPVRPKSIFRRLQTRSPSH